MTKLYAFLYWRDILKILFHDVCLWKLYQTELWLSSGAGYAMLPEI